MENISIFLFSLIIAAAVMAGCNKEEFPDNPVSNQSNDIGTLSKPSSELQKELALAKYATAKYHILEVAMDDGYNVPGPVVQNMGYHYINEGNISDTFDPGKPAILVYSKNPANGKMRLVAVEYAVPDSYPQPEGFTGDADVWEDNTDFGLWLCHAWVWYNNPDGIFNGTNPRVHVEEDEVTYP